MTEQESPLKVDAAESQRSIDPELFDLLNNLFSSVEYANIEQIIALVRTTMLDDRQPSDFTIEHKILIFKVKINGQSESIRLNYDYAYKPDTQIKFRKFVSLQIMPKS